MGITDKVNKIDIAEPRKSKKLLDRNFRMLQGLLVNPRQGRRNKDGITSV